MRHWHVVIRHERDRRLGALVLTHEAGRRELDTERADKHIADLTECHASCFGASPLAPR